MGGGEEVNKGKGGKVENKRKGEKNECRCHKRIFFCANQSQYTHLKVRKALVNEKKNNFKCKDRLFGSRKMEPILPAKYSLKKKTKNKNTNRKTPLDVIYEQASEDCEVKRRKTDQGAESCITAQG